MGIPSIVTVVENGCTLTKINGGDGVIERKIGSSNSEEIEKGSQ